MEKEGICRGVCGRGPDHTVSAHRQSLCWSVPFWSVNTTECPKRWSKSLRKNIIKLLKNVELSLRRSFWKAKTVNFKRGARPFQRRNQNQPLKTEILTPQNKGNAKPIISEKQGGASARDPQTETIWRAGWIIVLPLCMDHCISLPLKMSW